MNSQLSHRFSVADTLQYPEDFQLAQACLDGDAGAIRDLQEGHGHPLKSYLLNAGASVGEATEIVGDFWADILSPRPTRPPRLATYSGNSPLRAWLKAVALNMLLKIKRKNGSAIGPSTDSDTGLMDTAEAGPASPSPGTLMSLDAPLLEIMRDAVQAAFRECDAEDFLLVQLAHTNGLRGRELARMFAWSEPDISRALSTARKRIRESTMRKIRSRDPWLVLQWEDFIDLCRVASPACFGIE